VSRALNPPNKSGIISPGEPPIIQSNTWWNYLANLRRGTLADLAKTDPQAGDPALLDALPLLGDLLASAPPRLQQQLYQAFDIQALYKKNMHQVNIYATITDSTPRTVAAITADAGDSPATSSPDSSTPELVFSDLAQAPMLVIWLQDFLERRPGGARPERLVPGMYILWVLFRSGLPGDRPGTRGPPGDRVTKAVPEPQRITHREGMAAPSARVGGHRAPFGDAGSGGDPGLGAAKA
jgi:hypothetical protein